MSMWLSLLRYSSTKHSTLGVLIDKTTDDEKFLCYTLEDPYQKKKIPGKTRINSGLYNISLRTEGTTHAKYLKRFHDIHKGTLCIEDVEDFENILIHCGNTADDTAGCILVGDLALSNVASEGKIRSSEIAYKRIYKYIAGSILMDCSVRLHIRDTFY